MSQSHTSTVDPTVAAACASAASSPPRPSLCVSVGNADEDPLSPHRGIDAICFGKTTVEAMQATINVPPETSVALVLPAKGGKKKRAGMVSGGRAHSFFSFLHSLFFSITHTARHTRTRAHVPTHPLHTHTHTPVHTPASHGAPSFKARFIPSFFSPFVILLHQETEADVSSFFSFYLFLQLPFSTVGTKTAPATIGGIFTFKPTVNATSKKLLATVSRNKYYVSP